MRLLGFVCFSIGNISCQGNNLRLVRCHQDRMKRVDCYKMVTSHHYPYPYIKDFINFSIHFAVIASIDKDHLTKLMFTMVKIGCCQFQDSDFLLRFYLFLNQKVTVNQDLYLTYYPVIRQAKIV